MSDNEIREKHIRIIDLRSYLAEFPQFIQFFDVDSDKLLDEKIEVLEAIKAGKSIDEIPNFYDVLELMSKEGMWD